MDSHSPRSVRGLFVGMDGQVRSSLDLQLLSHEWFLPRMSARARRRRGQPTPVERGQPTPFARGIVDSHPPGSVAEDIVDTHSPARALRTVTPIAVTPIGPPSIVDSHSPRSVRGPFVGMDGQVRSSLDLQLLSHEWFPPRMSARASRRRGQPTPVERGQPTPFARDIVDSHPPGSGRHSPYVSRGRSVIAHSNVDSQLQAANSKRTPWGTGHWPRHSAGRPPKGDRRPGPIRCLPATRV